MKKLLLLVCMLFCIMSLSAQHHRTKVPALTEYDNTDIEENMNRLLNEVISLDFTECDFISSITSKDTIWLRNVKDPSKAKEGRHFRIQYSKAKIEDLQGKELLVKRIDTKIEGEYYRTFYSILTLVNIVDASDVYRWIVKTGSNHTSVSNNKIRIRSKRWSKTVNSYVCDGKYYYYHSPAYAKPSVENGHTEYVKIKYEECDFFVLTPKSWTD